MSPSLTVPSPTITFTRLALIPTRWNWTVPGVISNTSFNLSPVESLVVVRLFLFFKSQKNHVTGDQSTTKKEPWQWRQSPFLTNQIACSSAVNLALSIPAKCDILRAALRLSSITFPPASTLIRCCPSPIQLRFDHPSQVIPDGHLNDNQVTQRSQVSGLMTTHSVPRLIV